MITGGASGIGRVAALSFARKGAKVVIAGRNAEEGNKALDLLKEITDEAAFVQSDVTRESDVENMISETIKKFGQLDAAFNNAGIEGPNKLLADQTEADFETIVNVNLKGTFFCMKHQISTFMEQGRAGAIVNNASIAAHVGMPEGSIYAASKHGVVGLTKTAAMEYGAHNIRANVVSPASIHTTMLDRYLEDNATLGAGDEAVRSLTQKISLRRLGAPEEVADVAVWLCSDEASFVTGECIRVAGGHSSQ